MKTLLILSISIVVLIQCVPMVKRFQAGQTFCFSDDVPQHTLIRLKTKVQGPIQMQIQSMNVVYKNKQLNGEEVQSWTSQKYGIYKYCFINYQSSIGYLRYDYDIGQRAKDYSSSYDGDDYIKSLENQARIASTFIQDIQRENTQGLQMIIDESISAKSYTCVYALSTAFVLVSIALVTAQFKMVKKHLHNRKYL